MRGIRRSVFVGLVICCLSVVLSLPGYAEFYAVIIGVADYPGMGNDLSFTDDDAIDVRDALLDYANWVPGHITFLLNSAATKAGIEAEIASLASMASPEDVFVFYFSGHGATGADLEPFDETDGLDEYLCTYGEGLEEFLRDDEFEDWLTSLPMERILVLVDACFSGGQFKDVKSLGEGPSPRPGDGFAADLEEVVSTIDPQDLHGIAGKELVVLAAADDHEYAYELGHPYNHGLFSYYLLEAMEGGVIPSGDWISAEESFEYLEPRVVNLSSAYGFGQHPQMLDECAGSLDYLNVLDSDACWGAGWKTLRTQGSGFAEVEVGVSSVATGCYDLGLDLPAPPAIPGGEYTRAWLDVDEGCGGNEKLERDLREEISCGEVRTWTLHVEDFGPQMYVSIAWDAPLFDPSPACLRAATLTRWPAILDPMSGSYVIDTSGSALDRMDMVQTGSYTYRKAAEWDHSAFTVSIDCRTCSAESRFLAESGWHMISLPGELCDPCTHEADSACGNLVCALDDDLDPCFAYRYSPASRGYVRIPPADELCYRPGMSMWIYATQPNTGIDAVVAATGEAVEVPLGVGWNQVGNPYRTRIALDGFTIRCSGTEKTLVEAAAAGWISASLFAYDAATGGYAEMPSGIGCVPSWTGCWLQTFVDGCTLVVHPLACAASEPTWRSLRAEEILNRDLPLPPPPPRIEVADTSDAEAILVTLSAMNTPNPIRSEHTTVFTVQGIGADHVDEIRVEIYDLQGMRVFSEQVEDVRLVWHPVNDAGEPLANGVYLYRVSVRLGVSWYPVAIQRLAIVR